MVTNKSLTLSSLRYHYLFSFLSAISFSLCLFREFGTGSTNHALIDIFLYSHHLSVWYCIDIVRRNSLLVTHGSERVKSGPEIPLLWNSPIKLNLKRQLDVFFKQKQEEKFTLITDKNEYSIQNSFSCLFLDPSYVNLPRRFMFQDLEY